MNLLFKVTRNIARIVHGDESFIRPAARHGSFPRPGISIAGIALVLLPSAPGAGLAQSVDPDLWVTNDQVRSIVTDGITIYVGGDFTRIGPLTSSAAAIDASTGVVQHPYPRVEGYVRAVEPDGSGGWYLGGTFTAVQGQPRTNLAQLDAAGNLTAWNPNPNGVVYDVTVSGSTVYAGGSFTSIGGQPRSNLAALDAVTGAATAWDPNANSHVRASPGRRATGPRRSSRRQVPSRASTRTRTTWWTPWR
jgi:hypothetical protein